MPSAKEIVANPNWFLHAINLDQQQLHFVHTDQSALSSASFLDNRFDVRSLPGISLGLQELLEMANDLSAAPPRFVFHTAFCCSTLLARCLDLNGCSVSMKEPAVLMALANYQRTGHELLADGGQADSIYRLVALLLFRPFGEDQTVVVKPTNTVNNIICQLMATHPESRALLLHSDLKSFLLSILKKGEQGRGFVRQLFNIFVLDSPEAQQLQANKLLRMTDLQIAALTWHLQLEHFISAQQYTDATRMKSLHCDRLLANSEHTLKEVVSHLAMTKLIKHHQRMIKNAPLQRNAKTPDDFFTAEDRKNEYDQIGIQFADSLDVIIPWAEKLSFRYRYSPKVDNEL
ncbi:MAG: hypothetical protein HKN85_07185 [Gammaproteobacteria bacterium]|nr:hypothetical protein [Gammaproteobacteria bacterium]